MSAPGDSWGRWPRYAQRPFAVHHRFELLPDHLSMLPYGNGRSYGDVCQNENGWLLCTRGLDRFIAFDPTNGMLECEAGVLLGQIIQLVLPLGWFLPVTPGTSFATVGGAIANDVHGKNHHHFGTFGHCLIEFELQRSDGRTLICTPRDNGEWFMATIGGLGLTGLIRRAKLQLRRVPGPWLRGDNLRFSSLREFFALARESDREFEYTVAWLDCAAGRGERGRGVFSRANHVSAPGRARNGASLNMPLTPPVSLVNRCSLRLFNHWYFYRESAECRDALWHFRSFFYPLDRIANWNRVYGPNGFFQYQCVVPEQDAESSLTCMLERVARSGTGSFLAVLKVFGQRPSLGLLSFPRCGVTLALDFPNKGGDTRALLESLDEITRQAGGAVYPAKDARMSAQSFQIYFPAWQRFQSYIDPRFSSSFWRRVTASGA